MNNKIFITRNYYHKPVNAIQTHNNIGPKLRALSLNKNSAGFGIKAVSFTFSLELQLQ